MKRKTTKLALGEIVKPVKKRPKKVSKCVAVGNGAVKLTIEPGSFSEIEIISSRSFSLWSDTERYTEDSVWIKSNKTESDERVRDAKVLISLLNEFISSVETGTC